ncbi:MAG: preprotein translocase subunit SecE [bacterium]|nr:preprotein translocase subunit SecE [bacterium]
MKVFLFLREVRAELEKIVWPTRAETIRLTSLVLALSLIVGAYVGGLDFLFTSIVNSFLK